LGVAVFKFGRGFKECKVGFPEFFLERLEDLGWWFGFRQVNPVASAVSKVEDYQFATQQCDKLAKSGSSHNAPPVADGIHVAMRMSCAVHGHRKNVIIAALCESFAPILKVAFKHKDSFTPNEPGQKANVLGRTNRLENLTGRNGYRCQVIVAKR
jgi:hypothetical protein